MIPSPITSVWGLNTAKGLAKPLQALALVQLHFGNPKSSPWCTRRTKSGGFLAPLSWPRAETNGSLEPFGKAICQGWRMPCATMRRPLPLVLNDSTSYPYGVVGGPWSPVSDSDTPTYRRPLGPMPRALQPLNFFRAG